MKLQAYAPAWAHHEAVQAQARRWQRRGLLSAEQLAAVEATYPLTFYHPPLLLRVGLFIFTGLGALAGGGLLAVITQGSFLVTLILALLLGAVLLEAGIREKRFYRAGPDTALLYLELGGLLLLIGYLAFETYAPAVAPASWVGSPRLELVLLLSLAVLLAATLRYADRLVAAATLLTALLAVANLLLMLPTGSLLLPFGLLLTSAAAYRLVDRLHRRPEMLYYRRCLGLLRGLTLATAYLSVNYLVVREGNALLLDQSPSAQVPLAPLFYFFTAALPLLYLTQGLRRPDRTWLWLGVLTAAFSAFTLRHYRSVLPPETAAVLIGALLTSFAIWAIRYLRLPHHGLTSAPDDAEASLENIESLIVAQTAQPDAAPTQPEFEFGGGHSGGGGATGSY